MREIDTLIEARWIVPIRPRRAVLEHHALALDGGRILGIGPAAELRARHRPRRHLRLERHALLPGLINAHGHSAMALLRGAGEDLALERWLRERIWPLERALVAPEFVYDGARLAGLEMVLAGVTACNDMYFHPAETALGLRSVGLRAAVGIMVIDFPSRYASDADDYLRRGLAARDALAGDPLVHFTLAPHAPYTVSDATLRRIAALAEELDLPVHMHVHETAHEVAEAERALGARPLQRLDALGLVTERLIAVHATQLSSAEIELLARRGASVAHCPASNCKLGSGIAPLAALLAAGVNVGIGTDGAASNNRLDVLRDAGLAALLAKAREGDPTVVPAWQALECATLGGARCLGLEERIGSIEPGKEADLVAFDLSDPATQACYDVAAQIVHSAGREQATHVWVAGRAVVEDRVLTGAGAGATQEAILRAAAPWQNQVRQLVLETDNPPTESESKT